MCINLRWIWWHCNPLHIWIRILYTISRSCKYYWSNSWLKSVNETALETKTNGKIITPFRFSFLWKVCNSDWLSSGLNVGAWLTILKTMMKLSFTKSNRVKGTPLSQLSYKKAYFLMLRTRPVAVLSSLLEPKAVIEPAYKIFGKSFGENLRFTKIELLWTNRLRKHYFLTV